MIQACVVWITVLKRVSPALWWVEAESSDHGLLMGFSSFRPQLSVSWGLTYQLKLAHVFYCKDFLPAAQNSLMTLCVGGIMNK